MKRLTTDSPRDNMQTALNLFYIKNGWTWVRGGGPAPEYPDVSLCDYVRELIKVHISDEEVPDEDDELSDMMAEWLFDGPESMEGLIAALYTAGWAFSELRQHLAAYEDTGLAPEDLEKGFNVDAILKLAAQCLATTPDRLRELARADREGQVNILSKVEKCTCGDCGHFNRTPGTRSGTCSVREWYTDRYGHIDRHRGKFTPQQSRKSCKLYIARKEAETAQNEAAPSEAGSGHRQGNEEKD